jgi:hypothetical protein
MIPRSLREGSNDRKTQTTAGARMIFLIFRMRYLATPLAKSIQQCIVQMETPKLLQSVYECAPVPD